MNLNTLQKKYQWMIVIVVIMIIFALYIFFRLVPRYQEVSMLGKQLAADVKLLKNPKIPEEPLEDAEYLKKKLNNITGNIEAIGGQAKNLEQRLAPIDSQDVILKISAVARTSRVKVVQNLPYLVQRRAPAGESIDEKVKKKKLTPAAERKLRKKLQKQAKKAKKNAAKFGGIVGALTREGELMDKLVNDFAEARPLQEIKVEGTFDNLKKFIEGVQVMPWQVTIVKFDVDVKQVQKAPQGLPQLLSVKMIIGM
jgi:hypothetical protein